MNNNINNKKIPSNVKKLAWISLFTDMASDMLYPILPIFWRQRGITILNIGFIEGVAGFITNVSKAYWGSLSDKLRKYRIFVIIGYGLSAAAKPLLAVGNGFLWPFLVRNIERFGKAIRTSPRDAILASESDDSTSANIFSYHRSMDTIGAAIGPLICLAILHFSNNSINLVFAASIIPGIAAVIVSLKLKKISIEKEEYSEPLEETNNKNPSSLNLIKKALTYDGFKKLIFILGIFSLVNSSDAFLLLRLNEIGLSLQGVVLIYSIYNIINAFITRKSHFLIEKFGLKIAASLSIAVFISVYSILSFQFSPIVGAIGLLMYGFFDGTFDVITKTWISAVVPKNLYSTSSGVYGTINAFGFMISSIVTGLMLEKIGNLTFLAIGSLAIIPLILVLNTTKKDFE
jgi:MFS family permease